MAYNPYKAAEQIVRAKGAWATAVAGGKTGDAEHKSALPYYKELRDNGYNAVADLLEESDYGEALDFLDALSPENAPYSAADTLAAAASESGSLASRQYTLADALASAYDDLYKAQKDGEGDAYRETLAAYDAAGKNAALGTVADNAADNGGNINSYAAANAHRQYQTYLNAGATAAAKAQSESASTLLSILESMATSETKAQNAIADRLDAERDTAATLQKAEDDRALEETLARIKNGIPALGDADSAELRQKKYRAALEAAYPAYAKEIAALFAKG